MAAADGGPRGPRSVAAPSQEDDAALVERLRAGERSAGDELARRHLGSVARLVRRYVPASDAEDVAQRAIMRAFDRVDQFRGEASFKSWLYRLAVNVALNHVRDGGRRKTRQVEEADLITNALGTAKLVAREAKARLLAALEDLPPKQRMAVEKRLFEDLSFKEVGDAMEISEDAAKANFHHAMKRLRATVAPDDDTSS